VIIVYYTAILYTLYFTSDVSADNTSQTFLQSIFPIDRRFSK